ncbi:hypothetical protein ABH926_003094 [Catenulispora sp. GP43]|uniref:hypothetical protein n=1 Tax=Catenulispora sp. GP43 TaxID=3156263 RepID=UPI00351482AF
MHSPLKTLIVGAATALLAAACTSTGTTGTSPTAGTGTGTDADPGAAGTSAATATAPPSLDVTGTALGDGSPTSSTHPATAGKATVYGCDRQPVAQPKTYILACGDGGTLLNQLAWTGWGKAKATATGVQIQNSCQPSCAAGAPVSAKATVSLSGLTSGHYTKLSVVTAKGTTAYTIDAQGPLITGGR